MMILISSRQQECYADDLNEQQRKPYDSCFHPTCPRSRCRHHTPTPDWCNGRCHMRTGWTRRWSLGHQKVVVVVAAACTPTCTGTRTRTSTRAHAHAHTQACMHTFVNAYLRGNPFRPTCLDSRCPCHSGTSWGCSGRCRTGRGWRDRWWRSPPWSCRCTCAGRGPASCRKGIHSAAPPAGGRRPQAPRSRSESSRRYGVDKGCRLHENRATLVNAVWHTHKHNIDFMKVEV